MKIDAKYVRNPAQGWEGWIGRYRNPLQNYRWSFIGAPHETREDAIEAARLALERNTSHVDRPSA